ncbi:DNA restriction methylase [Enterobacterales bacterium 8AC]|nr:DNA restriction methylase [Enterobacterales bacterium 8AC]
MSELVLDNEFFAPASTDLIDSLIGQYKQLRSDVEMMAGLINTHQASVYHFLEGNQRQDRHVRSVSELFKLEGAIASLNATFWQKALNMTDVYEYMPNNRREEWNEQIRNPQGVKAKRTGQFDPESSAQRKEWSVEPLPDFEEEAVRPTIMALLNARQQFFSERVDGIFRALSGEHVTNRPEGFGKRMILARVYNEWGSTEYRTAGYIQDLRIVIAKFMGRDEPRWNATDSALLAARRRPGEWLTLDGGALRVRGYLKGTAHLEVHPEMAWRLNCILAQLYPMAIPPQFRQKPKRKLKDFVMMGKPLPFAVLGELAKMKAERHTPWQRERWEEVQQPLTTNPLNRSFGYGDYDKTVREQAEKVLESIGGVKVMAGPLKNIAIWEFDYEPASALDEIIASGCIPDQKSHQFYPTPPPLAELCIQLANIGPHDNCLEPSAGTGGIADYLPRDRTTCIEISSLHCKILEAKGFAVIQADFIKWAENSTQAFDCIVMNPPFSEGRAVAHVQAAAGCLKPGGRLVAIMPAGSKGKDILPGWNVDWSEIFSNEFAGTSISVVILIAERANHG